jgi:hypothetical protein
MFSWLCRRDPVKKLQMQYEQTLLQARDVQRNGDIIRYSEIVAEADCILQQIDAYESTQKKVGRDTD